MNVIAWIKSFFNKPTEEKTNMSKVQLAIAVIAGVFSDGVSANTITVLATDDAGNPLVGQLVTLKGDSDVVISGASLTTDANGTATAALTSTVAGTYQLEAFLADGTTQAIDVPFLTVPAATAAPAALSALDSLKADFEKEVEWIEHGIEVFGEAAEAELVALRNKFR